MFPLCAEAKVLQSAQWFLDLMHHSINTKDTLCIWKETQQKQIHWNDLVSVDILSNPIRYQLIESLRSQWTTFCIYFKPQNKNKKKYGPVFHKYRK